MNKLFLLPLFVCLTWPALAQVTARKTVVLLSDMDTNNKASPGDILRYTIVITNTSTTNLLNVQFSDANFPNQTLVAGSIKSAPIARPDAYNAIGNTLLNVSAPGLLANDSDPDGDTVVAIAGPFSTTGGGSVTVTNNGGFSYISGAGFTGADTFNYTISDGNGGTSSSTVTITIGSRVWYVNNAGGNGDGRQTSPFNSLGGAGAASAANDYIYVFPGSGNYIAGILLKTGQQLVGSGDALVVTGTTIFPADTRPTILAATGTGVSLGTNNIVHGLNIGSASGRAISGASVGNLIVSNVIASATGDRVVSLTIGTVNVTLDSASSANSLDSGISLSSINGSFVVNGGSIASPTGTGISITGGSFVGSIATSVTKNNPGRAVDISGQTGGTMTLSGTISQNNSGGTGISLASNTGATINFTGAITLITGNNAAFAATGGGTVTATASGSTLNSGNGTALNVVSTTIGRGGLTFQSISSSGGSAAGIILDGTGNNGGLTVTGTGTAASGGTISSKTGGNTTTYNTTDGRISINGGTPVGVGIFLRGTRDVFLTQMQLNDFSNYGILGETVNNFTLDSSTINGTSGDTVNAAASTPPEGSVFFSDLVGNATFTNCIVNNLMPQNSTRITETIRVMNNGGTLTLLNLVNCAIANNTQAVNPGGGDGLFFGTPSGLGSGAMNLKINNCNFTAAYASLINAAFSGSATSDVTITNSHFSNANENIATPNGNASGSTGIILGGGGTDVYVHYLIQNNTFQHNSGSNPGSINAGGLLVTGIAAQTGTFEGKILSNTFGVTGVARSGSGNGADALRLFASGNNGSHGNTKILVQGNTIKQYGEVGIQINARQGNAAIDATVLGNIINEPGPAAQGAFAGIWVNAGALPPDTSIVNIAIGGTAAADKNTMADSDPSNTDDVFLDCNTPAHPNAIHLYRNGSTAAGSGEALIRQILVDDNSATLDLLAGFINGSTITVVAGLPTQAP